MRFSNKNPIKVAMYACGLAAILVGHTLYEQTETINFNTIITIAIVFVAAVFLVYKMAASK